MDGLIEEARQAAWELSANYHKHVEYEDGPFPCLHMGRIQELAALMNVLQRELEDALHRQAFCNAVTFEISEKLDMSEKENERLKEKLVEWEHPANLSW